MRFIVLVFIAACAAEGHEFERVDLPHVAIFFDDNVRQPERVLEGAELWGELGFTFSEEPSGMVQCSSRWFERDSFDCEISILVSSDFTDRPEWGHSIREVREVALRIDILDRRRTLTAAHEFGHILLDVTNAEHLPSGGIMAVEDLLEQYEITDADRALAPWL